LAHDRPAAGPSTSVAIDPSTWWMESGTNTTLVATWVEAPAGCSLEPRWFRWTISSGGSEGSLGPTNGSSVTFFATDQGTGTTTVEVRSAASLDCRGNLSASFSGATAAVTVAAPFSVDDLSFAAAPVAPGAPAVLVGTVVGGEPPYRLRVAWGDGLVTSTNLSGPGPLSVQHTYAGEGSYEPALLAIDAAGRTASAAPDEPLSVSATFAAAIVPSDPVAEVGVPVTFAVRTSNAPSSFSSLFACQNADPAPAGASTGLVYGCEFNSAGVAPVQFEAVGGSSPFLVATATLEETVAPPPSLEFPSSPPTAEVGGTVYAPIEVAGGVAPYNLSWSLIGTGASGAETIASAGAAYLPLASGISGALLLSVVLLDALGQAAASAQEAVVFVPGLVAEASASATTAGGTVVVNISASAVEGSAPLDWTVVPATAAFSGSADAGSLAGPGAFGWNATFRDEGTTNVTVAVVDAVGVSMVLNLTVALAPRLTVVAEVDPTGPGSVSLRADLEGGVGPYSYRWNDSAGESWNGTVAGGGPIVLRVATAVSGPATFSVAVVDALGVSASSEARATVPGSTALSVGGSGGATAAVVVAIVALGAGGAFLLRRRRPHEAPPSVDPVAVLREVIEPSDGVDRGMVELLAEERGVSLEEVRSTLERLKADGTVRAGRGSDGEEVLAWSRPAFH
jgi:hypothetical protein